jgi:hypothetical protein
MRATRIACTAVFAWSTLCIAGAAADDRSEYNRRAAARYVTFFQALDRDRDKTVTKTEAHGDLNFGPRFDDMDINRDRIVTVEELQRFIEREHGAEAVAALR